MIVKCANPSCKNTFENKTGRRPKVYCSPNCKQKCWQKSNKGKVTLKPNMVELPADYVNWKSIGILKADGTIEELKDISQLPENFRIGIDDFRSLDDEQKGKATVYKKSDTENKELNKEVLDNSKNEERIKQLEKEINNPPAKFTSLMAKQAYFFDRRKELAKLKSA